MAWPSNWVILHPEPVDWEQDSPTYELSPEKTQKLFQNYAMEFAPWLPGRHGAGGGKPEDGP